MSPPSESKKNSPTPSASEASFAETALRLGGKSEDEARRTGAIDKADDQVETLYRPQYQTVNSPAHRAVWDRQLPVEEFADRSEATPDATQKVMDRSIEIVRNRRSAGTLMNEERRIDEAAMQELGGAGYWGLLVEQEYGGSGASFNSFAKFLTRMAMVDPTVAGLASVHGCIGAVDPVRAFGNAEQKQRFLPRLASGESLSGFALTEPAAGSDLTALSTHAVLSGDQYLVTGEKLFITNVLPGRTLGLVCLIEDKPAVLVCDLPDEENEQFQIKKYGLYALKHTYNRGIVFRDFPIPAENLLNPVRGSGLTIAYHGLNLGRVSLCANAAGTMRTMLASIIPWSQFRVTYGAPIVQRELVRRRMARLAGLIVGCDALVDWCSGLIDAGYRGEMECIIAKIFGSESQKEAAIELFMKTHGGRSFLHGHLFGDNVHEYLAPCIYEGEGEMLGMAFFKSLVKHHGMQFFEPIGKTLAAAGIKKPNMLNPAHLWKLKGPMTSYAAWLAGETFKRKSHSPLPPMPSSLRGHAEFACKQLGAMPREISGAMRRHQLKLADRQCRMSELSSRVQKMILLLCTSLYASRQSDEIISDAANILCHDLRHALTGERPSDRYYRAANQLGEKIADGGFSSIAGLNPDEVLMPY